MLSRCGSIGALSFGSAQDRLRRSRPTAQAMGGSFDRSADLAPFLLVVDSARPSLVLLALPVHSTGRCISIGALRHGSTSIAPSMHCGVFLRPGFCGAQLGPVEGGTTGDGPVRALRRPPLALQATQRGAGQRARLDRRVDGAAVAAPLREGSLCTTWIPEPEL